MDDMKNIDPSLLSEAFHTFTEASKKLELQFQELEHKADELTAELREKNAALMASLREKEDVIKELRRIVENAISGVNTEKIRHISPIDDGIITRDPKMLQIIGLVKGIAKSGATVLILGESGTGKELLSKYIHNNSLRKGRPFVAVNCAAIPDSLLESELFGYEKGAFTGAAVRKPGKFELADTGTILLDEIGEMSLVLQAKLLRVIQEREVDRIGGKTPVPLDIRVIATTNRDIKKEMESGRFREDLYYRLNVFPITLPPLRERRDDVPLLAEHFIRKFAKRNMKGVTALSDKAVSFLKGLPWKGNVRELENFIERAVLLCDDKVLSVEHLVFEDGESHRHPEVTKESVKEMKGTVSDVERNLILNTLREVNGNRTKAAMALGISLRTLRNKLSIYRETGVITDGHFVDAKAKVA